MGKGKNKDKELYVRSKNFLRGLIQKLFLKLLLKLFPKKFSSYKNNVKNIMNKGGFYLFFVFKIIYLRFKYPLYINLPFKNIYMLHTLFNFLQTLKQQKIDFFLVNKGQ